MATEILMPAAAAGVEQATLIRWLKKAGEPIKKGEALAEVETDKAIMEIEADSSGVLGQILVPGGTEAVKVGSVIGWLIAPGEEWPAASTDAIEKLSAVHGMPPIAAAKTASDLRPATQATTTSQRIFASPLARRLATEKGINLTELRGSGPHGRIVRADLDQSPDPGTPTDVSAATIAGGARAATYECIPHTGMRKTIARRLTQAMQQIPHYYLSIDCRVDRLLAAREQLNARGGLTNPVWKLSVNDFIVAAVARTLRQVPEVNASWTEDAIHRWNEVDVCVAVSTDSGLITPIVRSADRKGLRELSLEIRALAEKARSGKLVPSEYQGGGFTISNLGMYGISRFTAVINPPQAAILAVGSIEKRAVVDGDQIVVGHVMTLTLSADHRLIDGALGARFLDALRVFAEDPVNLLA